MPHLQAFQSHQSQAREARTQSEGNEKQDIWSSLLDNVASGKHLPEKHLLVLGGSASTQKEIFGTLGFSSVKARYERYRRKPPFSNDFALGYTYQNILDTDHEDILARLSIYTLSSPSLSFVQLLRPLINPLTVPDTLLVILLDWSEPWNWLKQLKQWIALLHQVLTNSDEDTRSIMQDIMRDWEQGRRGGIQENSGTMPSSDSNTVMPLAPGEWDEPLGLPLCVVCHNAEQLDVLEQQHGWGEEEFDYILQFLRTILLKHGASLIYTSSSVPSSLSPLIQNSLGVQSSLKKEGLKHNVVDRDRILIPPNWDSWGKIRVLREGFDVEGVSRGWSSEIQRSMPTTIEPAPSSAKLGEVELQEVSLLDYQKVIKNPKATTASVVQNESLSKLDVETTGMQDFLASQVEVLERLKNEEEWAAEKDPNAASKQNSGRTTERVSNANSGNRLNEHIGPVQFNMGGIQVDAEDMLSRLKGRAQEETLDREGSTPPTALDGKAQNETLANFFAGLIKRGGTSSPKAASS